MNKACTRIISDVITSQHWHFMIPEAFAELDAIKRVLQRPACRIDVADTRIFRHLRRAEDICCEIVCHRKTIADFCERFEAQLFLGHHSFHLIEAIADLRVEADRLVRRNGPRGRRPDDHREVFANNREFYPDRCRLAVVILNLGFGERGLLHRRPHDRFRAAIQQTGHCDGQEFRNDLRFGFKTHGQVWSGVRITVFFIPFRVHAETTELLALNVDPVCRIFTAGRAEF